ncbi:hypothetical protein HO173_004565 [Letharia columbiana]|uniref:Ankyrin repeat protein n=1 Tax=Letharia columbiana TaxID=112416 RepID=A0A8H6FYC8_9LECA|nr:uncharacterized protein HO173_004565 [Letharia columbiana]KAF6237097.1 hypothetical protein HO173_004565 [Letharia columbiana]
MGLMSTAIPGQSLRAASRQGHENVVKMLLDNGANVNAPSGSQRDSPLWAASRRGHENVAKMLIAEGAVMPNEESTRRKEKRRKESEESEEEDDPPAQQAGAVDPFATPAIAN